MADEKIKISWEEVNSPEVDLKVKQQELLGRVQDHYQPQPVAAAPWQGQPRPKTTNFWRNSLVYMAVFGLVGGLVAWGLGEISLVFKPQQRQEFLEFAAKGEALSQSVSRGEVSKADGDRLRERLKQEHRDNPYIVIVADQSLSEAEKLRRMDDLWRRDGHRDTAANLMFFCLVGISIAIALAIADPFAGRNWRGVVINGSVATLLGLLGGAVGGFAAQALYSALLGGTVTEAKQIFARAFSWALLGLFLAIAPGVVLRNWKRLGIGLGGGLLGGFLGGFFFDPVTMVGCSDLVSRLVGLSAIGAIAGVGTGLLEQAAKTGWLQVVGGLIIGKQFVLYKNPTYLGSSPQCEIYLFKDPQVSPRHAAIHTIAGGYELEDLNSASQTFVNGRPVSRLRLRSGDQIQIGTTVLRFQEKQRTA